MKLLVICAAVCCVYVLMPATVCGQSGTDVNNVLTYIYTNNSYNKKIRPLTDQTLVMDIAVDFVLSSVIEFDEQNENLKTAGYLYFTWTDEYLVWTPSDYNDVQSIFVPQDDIWKPDVSLRNSYKTFTGLGSSYLNVYVGYDGSVDWYPFQVLESTCSIDITYFPFDKQTCELKFTAWSYTKAEVNLNVGTKGIEMLNYSPNNQWSIIDTDARETNSEEAAVYFSMKLKRKPMFYIINVIVPVVMLSLLNCFTFLLPVASGERAGYSITVFLSLAVFLTIVASQLPKNSDTTSLLAIYLMLMTSLSTSIVLLCLVELRISTRTVQETPINKGFVLLYKMERFLRCKTCKRGRVEVLPDTEPKPEQKEELSWMDVVNAMDFAFFFLSTVFTLITTVVIFMSASQGA